MGGVCVSATAPVTSVRPSQGSSPTNRTVRAPGLQTRETVDSKTRPRAALPVTTELGAKCKLRETVVDGIFVSVPVALVRTNAIRPQTGAEFRRVHPFPGSPPVTQAKSPEPEAPERRRGLPPPVSLLQDLAVTERALRCRPRLRDTCQRPPRSPPQVCGGTSSTDLTGRKPA